MSNISITYNTSTESNVTQEFNTADELKTFISTNKSNFTGTMKVICDNSITNCTYMFNGCANITSLDLSEFDTSNVTKMNGMFYNCRQLTSLNISNFNTSKVTNMMEMFSNCQSLTSLNITNFNTSNIFHMSYMFYNCNNLTSLDISNFDISNLMNTNYMFSYCSNLTTIYCGKNWKTNKITDSTNMFDSCPKLKGAISYDSTKTDINYANPTIGYFIYPPAPPRKFLVNLNMDQNEIKNMLLDKRNTNSLNPVTGQIYYNITDKKTYLYNGTEWEEVFSYKEDFSLTEAQTYEPIS